MFYSMGMRFKPHQSIIFVDVDYDIETWGQKISSTRPSEETDTGASLTMVTGYVGGRSMVNVSRHKGIPRLMFGHLHRRTHKVGMILSEIVDTRHHSYITSSGFVGELGFYKVECLTYAPADHVLPCALRANLASTHFQSRRTAISTSSTTSSSASAMTNHPWIVFSYTLMNHSKMQSLPCLMSCKFWHLREVAKRRLSHHALLTSFIITITDPGTLFASHSLSRARGR